MHLPYLSVTAPGDGVIRKCSDLGIIWDVLSSSSYPDAGYGAPFLMYSVKKKRNSKN